jgi:thiol:disulfide interchange protein
MHVGSAVDFVRNSWSVLAFLLALAIASPAPAQLQELDGLLPTAGGGGFGKEKVKASGHFSAATADAPAMLYVTAEVQPGWHIYSTTQPKGGTIPSRIKIEESADFKLLGDFATEQVPNKHAAPEYDGLVLEEHEGKVTWFAPIELAKDVDPKSLVIKGAVYAQACSNACIAPKDYKFEAKLGEPVALSAESLEKIAAAIKAAVPGEALPPNETKSADDYQAKGSHVIWRGEITPAVAAPGEEVVVRLTAVPVEQFHLYGYAAKDARTPQASKPTLILLTDRPDWTVAGPAASAEPAEHPSVADPTVTERYYESPVAFTYRLKVPDDAKPGKHNLTGMIGYQACLGGENGVCDLPLAAQFNGHFEVATAGNDVAAPLHFAKGKSYTEVSKLADGESPVPPASAAKNESAPDRTENDASKLPLLSAIGFGFLGGLILNLMPCVLPVIGLKVLSFVEQAGKEHRHVFALNAVYSLGILSVFLVLAGMLTAFQFGWGKQFSYAGFNITMTSVIFVMALSFLGVWEIPIPGFVGGSKATALARKEGWSGTFTKGVLTTLLATPCSGPGLGTALAWCADKPAVQVYAVFTSMGLGMASPYLLIGAFPALIRFLPKPGAWMDTFKQIMGFVLLGTVAYMLTLVSTALVVPTVTLLFGLWAACWWIGRMPYTATGAEKAKTWIQAAAVSVATYLVAFVGWAAWTPEAISFVGLKQLMEEREEDAFRLKLALQGGENEIRLVEDANANIPWNPYTERTLAALTSSSRPVLIDFTAEWCQTCKALEKFVLNTTPVREKLKELQIVPLKADMTEYPVEPTEWLDKFAGTQQIPVVAIYAPGETKPSKVFIGNFSQADVLTALEMAAAGPATERTASLKP